jgi:RNA polymerase sigma factor (sigma-70 family)
MLLFRSAPDIDDLYAWLVTRAGPGSDDQSFTELAALARAGDERAWRMLCNRLRNVVWKTVNGFRLGAHDAQDAFAATFFRLAEHLGDVRDPERLPGWIARTATHEVYGILRARRRLEPVADHDEVSSVAAEEADHDTRLLRSELQNAIYEGLKRLPQRCQRLLRLLIAEPALDYHDIGLALGVPHGSIGPTRRRCLDQLGRTPEVRPYLEERSR